MHAFAPNERRNDGWKLLRKQEASAVKKTGVSIMGIKTGVVAKERNRKFRSLATHLRNNACYR
jgi:hypothetical protein